LKSLSVSWSSGVKDEEAVQSLAAIVGAISELYRRRWRLGMFEPLIGVRPFGNWVIPAWPEGSPYSSFDWYVQNAFDKEWQAVDGTRFLDLVEDEPWQQAEHHYDFSLLHLPIRQADSADPLPYVSRPGVAVAISTDWVRHYEDAQVQRLVLRRLTFFGLGLAFDLTPHEEGEVLCAMRPFRAHADLLIRALEEHRHRVIYCEEHERELLGILLSGRQPLN
jgi:hypothetical protein